MRKKTGGRQKGTPNKITSEIRDKISILVSGTIDSIDINTLTHLPYTLPIHTSRLVLRLLNDILRERAPQ